MIFEFDLEEAIKHQLLARLEECPLLKLGIELNGLIEGTGVYVLYGLDGIRPLYAGKATNVGLRTRLNQHNNKLISRDVDTNNVYYKALHIGPRWLIRAAEDILIYHFSPAWNGTGFGNHPAGRGRPGVRKNKWDSMFLPSNLVKYTNPG